MDAKGFLGKKWLLVIAHPDDESYLFAGSIYKNWQAGGSCAIVCATHGGRGSSHLTALMPEKKLATLRRKELDAASKVLQVKKVHLQDIADCECGLHEKEFFRFVLKVCREEKPQVVVGFWRDGFTGHFDHIAAHRVSKRLSKKMGIPMLGVAMPPALRKFAKKFFDERKKNGIYKAIRSYDLPDISIPVNGRIKRKALLCHASQLDNGKILTNFPKRYVTHLFAAEHFKVLA